MASSARLLVLLQVTLFIASAMIMTVCHGARDVGMTTPGSLDPNRPSCISRCSSSHNNGPYTRPCLYGRCQSPGDPYYTRLPGHVDPYGPRPGHGGGVHPYPHIPAPPPNEETARP
ncbi:hypothetical protein QOZ80_6BG0497230 [Eleusine coracana subsp. coracana]|nr:hypothetical protein QOZ80_6BG0497230 [Eleusine coracana subsp. coracana]